MAVQIHQDKFTKATEYFEEYTSTLIDKLDRLSQKFFKSRDNDEIDKYTSEIINTEKDYIEAFNKLVKGFKENKECAHLPIWYGTLAIICRMGRLPHTFFLAVDRKF